jgi:hypothetical protein
MNTLQIASDADLEVLVGPTVDFESYREATVRTARALARQYDAEFAVSGRQIVRHR